MASSSRSLSGLTLAPVASGDVPYQMIVMGAPVTYFVSCNGNELVPLYALREFDLRFLRDADQAGYFRLKCQSEQSTRARLRRIIGRLQLQTIIGNRVQTRMLKHLEILGRRAPKCCLLSHGDMKILLNAFGRHPVSNSLEAAWNQTLLLATYVGSASNSSEDMSAATGMLQASEADPLGMPTSIDNVVGMVQNPLDNTHLPNVPEPLKEDLPSGPMQTSSPMSPMSTARDMMMQVVSQVVSQGLGIEVKLAVHTNPSSSSSSLESLLPPLQLHPVVSEELGDMVVSPSANKEASMAEIFEDQLGPLVDYDTTKRPRLLPSLSHKVFSVPQSK